MCFCEIGPRKRLVGSDRRGTVTLSERGRTKNYGNYKEIKRHKINKSY